MKLDREIKVFQILFLNLFLYVIWCDVVNIIFMCKVNHSVFIIVFIASILLMIINEAIKENSKYNVIALIIPSIITFLIVYYKYSLNRALFSMIYALLVLVLMYNTKDTIMEYKSVKDIGKISLVIAFITVIGTTFFMKNQLFEDLIKYILILLVSNVILLRETRCYSHNLNDKKMRIMNVGIGIFFFVTLSEKVENLFKQGVATAYDFITSILVKGVVTFVKLTSGFWEFLWGRIRYPGELEKIMKKLERSGEKKPKCEDLSNNDYVLKKLQNASQLTINIVKIIILIIIIVIIYKFIKRYIVGASSKNENEIREKISVKRDKKDNKFMKSIKRFMNGKGSIREQIYYIFGNFQNKAYSTELYKQGMTASELNNATKNHIKDKETEIDDITGIYNEAKFSNHTMEKEHLEVITNGYKEIKGDL